MSFDEARYVLDRIIERRELLAKRNSGGSGETETENWLTSDELEAGIEEDEDAVQDETPLHLMTIADLNLPPMEDDEALEE